MQGVLDTHDDMLRARARLALGDGPEVEEVVQRTRRRMLALDHPNFAHAVRPITRTLRSECQAVLLRRTKEPKRWREARARGVPVDAVLGPIEGTKAEAVARLSPRQRERLQLAWSGWRPREIAAAEHRSVGVIRLALHNARQQLLDIATRIEGSLALVLLLPARLRHGISRWLHALSEAASPPMAGLVPVIACSLWWSVAAPAPASAPLVAWGATAISARTTVTSPAVVHPVAPALSESTENVATQSTVRATPRPLHGAAAETPDDVRLTAAATPPGASSSVIAIGYGITCGCPVLLQSLDGGATWTATDGPPLDANQLVLPPRYPADPRIFAGVSALSATSSPYVSARFGAPFQPMGNVPPGQLGLSSHFDETDPRLFVSSLTGIWSVVMVGETAASPHQQVTDGGMGATSNDLAALATPPPSSAAAMFAWLPPLATVPGPPTSAPSASATFAICPVGAPCQVKSALPIAPWQLAVDEQTGATVVAYTRTQALISRDGGQSFAALSVPAGVATLQSVGLSGSGMWVSASRSDGSTSVLEQVGSDWRDTSRGDGLLEHHLAVLTVVGPRHILAALLDAGYRCTIVDSIAWRARCDST